MGIQAVDDNNNIIEGSGIVYSAYITPVSATPTIGTPTVTSVIPSSYTVSWTTSIPTQVRVRLFNNDSTNSNTGGTLVQISTFNADHSETQNISIPSPYLNTSY
jgi:hypothetical protein